MVKIQNFCSIANVKILILAIFLLASRELKNKPPPTVTYFLAAGCRVIQLVKKIIEVESEWWG